jgi:hypothetical protein
MIQHTDGLPHARRAILVNDPELDVPPIPPPAKIPKLTSALLFKVPGGVSGEIGKKLVYAKEIERRLGLARSKQNASEREAKKSSTNNSDWTVASESLTLLKTNQFNLKALNKPQLQSLVRVLKVGNAALNKGPLQDLLRARFGGITASQFQALETTVQRGVALALLPPTQSDGPALALPTPAVVAPPQPELAGAPALQLQ